LSALHDSFPNAEIFWLVRTEFAPLLKGHPYLKDIILFDRKFLGKAWKNPKAFGELVSLITRLRKENFDIVLDLQGLFRTASLSWLSGCKKRIGPGLQRELSHFFYTKKVKQDESCWHAVDYNLKIASEAGCNTDNAEFILPQASSETKSRTKQLLNENQVDNTNYVLLIPSSAHIDKCWPVQKFAELGDKIYEKFKLSIAVVGTKYESYLAEQIQKHTQTRIINLCGKTDIQALVELLRKSKLVISNDTGPGHIAAALQAPLVMIFGRTNPIRVAPYHRPESIAAININSRGNVLHNFEPKYDIMHITVDEVFEKARAQIRPAT
jgi:heptosyltransferase-1